MDEKKYLNGNLTRNIAFGLCWLPMIGWIVALFVFIVDKAVLTHEEKQELVAVWVANALIVVINLIPVIGTIAAIVIAVFALIACIKAFMGKTFEIPGVSHIAKAILK